MPRKPELQDILALKRNRQALFSQLREAQEKALDTYEMEDSIGIAKPYSVLRTPRARNLIDVPVDHIIADKAVVTVNPRNIQKRYQEEADLHEKFLQGWSNTLTPLFREQAKNLILYGECFFKTLVDDAKLSRMEDEPDKKNEDAHLKWEVGVFDNFPLVMLGPCPTTIYWHPQETNNRPYDVFEIYQRDAFEVEEKWEGIVRGFSQMHYGTTLEWCEWWSEKWRGYFIGGENLYPVMGDGEEGIIENKYGFVPYRHAIAGYGQKSASFEPHRWIKSILFPAYDIIKFESRIISQLDTLMTKFAHPTPIKTGQWDSSRIDYSPGHEIELPEGKFWKKDFEIIPGVEPPQSVYNTLNLLGGFFEQVQPGVVRGQAIGASAPAYANEAMVGQTRLKYGGPLMALEEAAAGAFGDGLRLAELVIDKPLSVHGTGNTGHYIQTIRPEEINGFYLCEVDLQSKDPSLSEAKKRLGLTLYQAKTISLTEFKQNYCNEPNATESIAKLVAEDIALNDPAQRAAYVKHAMEVQGMEQELELIKQQEEKNKKIDQWQAKKNEQFGTPGQVAAQNIQEGLNTNGQEMMGKSIPRLDNPAGVGPLNGSMENA